MYIHVYIHTHTFTQGINVYISRFQYAIYMYIWIHKYKHCIWVGCQGGAHVHQGDENPTQHCLPATCQSLVLSLTPVPSLSLLCSLAPQSLKKEIWRGFWGKVMNVFQKIFLRSPVSVVEMFPGDLDVRPWEIVRSEDHDLNKPSVFPV
jgi:hypothetical protein